jgi:YVTN family beta-propeller protein
MNFRLCPVFLTVLLALSCNAGKERPSQTPGPAASSPEEAPRPEAPAAADASAAPAAEGAPEPAARAAPEKALPAPPEAQPPEEPEFPYILQVKSGPPDTKLFLNGEELKAMNSEAGIRSFSLPGAGNLRFHAGGFTGREFPSRELPGLLKNGRLEIKLEKAGGSLVLIQEAATGWQPKSAYFSPEGDRVFVPLLGQSGIDVFRLVPQGEAGAGLVHEKRLTVPGSGACGFVEAMTDPRRRELWVSNMEEHCVHVYNLDSLEYKTRIGTGRMPKVIVLSPSGDLAAVSNWLSQSVSLIDPGTREALAEVPVGGTPRGMAFSPDGALLYTAIFDRPEIAVIDMAQKKVKTRFTLYEGEGAARHVLYRDGKLLVSDMYRGRIAILDAASGKLLKQVRAGPNLNTIALSPGGKRLLVSSRGRNNPDDYTRPGPEFGTVSVLSPEDLGIEETIWGRNQPTGLAVSPDGNYMVFTDFLDANLELYKIRQVFQDPASADL